MTVQELFQIIKEQEIELDKNNGAFLYVGAQDEHHSQALQGKGINIITAITFAMHKDEDLQHVLCKSVDVYRAYLKACKPTRWQRFLNLFRKSESSEE